MYEALSIERKQPPAHPVCATSYQPDNQDFQHLPGTIQYPVRQLIKNQFSENPRRLTIVNSAL